MVLALSDRCRIKEVGRHQYCVLFPTVDSDWLEYIAERYVELRTATAVPLNDLSLDGIQILEVEGLRRRIHEASVPRRRLPRNFDVVRSDFGEVSSYILLSELYGTLFGYLSVRDRELAQFPGRGIDVVGVENEEKLTILLGEVKVSDEKASPPRVVDENGDSLGKQHKSHLGDLPGVAHKIFHSARLVNDEKIRDLLFCAMVCVEQGLWDRVQLVTFCLLVRPESFHVETDFGSFIERPDDFSPADIRFLIFCVPDRIEDTIKAWHSLLNSR